MSTEESKPLANSVSSEAMVDIELAETKETKETMETNETKETEETNMPSSVNANTRGMRSSSAGEALKDAQEALETAQQIVADRHLDAVVDDLEADPSNIFAAPDEEAFQKSETKVLESKNSVPSEAKEIVKVAKKRVMFAEESKQEDGRGGHNSNDSETILIRSLTTKADLMKGDGLNTVLAKSTHNRGRSAMMQRTLYFKEPALLETKTDLSNMFDPNAPSVTPASSKQATAGADEADDDNLLAKAAVGIARTDKAKELKNDSQKFGMVDGVIISCLLNIFGVIMFLRLGWVIGQAGIVQAILIILMAGVVTTITTMSMAAIATNGKVKGGGAYYMISRALGPEIGGTIGALFFLGLSVAVSIYVIGFCEVLVDNLKVCPNVRDLTTGELSICDPELVKLTLTGNKLNDIRVWGVSLVTFILVMAMFGTGWVIQVQKYLMVLLCCTIASIFIGSFVNYDINQDRLNGFLGPGSEIYELQTINGTQVAIAIPGTSNFAANMASQYTPQMVGGQLKEYGFFSVFAIFFPAVTGIMAGANISGMLKDPAKDIGKGTFWAVGLSTIVYIMLVIVTGATCSRSALLNDYFIMMKMELLWDSGMELGWLVLIGVYAATFSSALASIVGAPQMLFSVAIDRILPLGWFTTTHKATWKCCRHGGCNSKVLFGCYERVDSKTNEMTGKPTFTLATEETEEPGASDPIYSYFISFIVAVGCILIGDMNFIAPLIAMFFMMTYGLLNGACFALAYYETPGWRPSFQYFHYSGALAGAMLCLFCMFLTDVLYTAIALTVGLLLTGWIFTREVQTNWGTVLDAKSYSDALKGVLHLRTIRQHAKTFRPKYLLFGGDVSERRELCRFMYTLRKGHGGVFVGRVVIGDCGQDLLRVRERFEDCYTCLNDTPVMSSGCCGYGQKMEKIPGNEAFAPLDIVLADNFYNGACSLMQTVGVGALRPNTVVLGYKKDWMTTEDVNDSTRTTLKNYVSTIQVAFKMRFGVLVCRNMDQITWDAPSEDGTVDVWALMDDGGLTFLVPYIMSQAPFWEKNTRGGKKTKIRLYFIFPDGHNTDAAKATFDQEWENTKNILNKYRFDWEVMDPLEHNVFMADPTYKGHPSFSGNPDQNTVDEFNDYPGITPLEETIHKTTGEPNAEVATTIAKWLRIGEVIRYHSGNRMKNSKTKLIYVTLPHPRSFYEDRTYMGIIDMLSKDMPPMVMIKGNCKLNQLTEFMD